MKVTIDNITLEVEPGTTIMQAARMIGPEVAPPAMCYYEPLKGSGGKCRACLVKVTAGSEKDPRPMPKLVPACITAVQDGMIVENTVNEDVLETRKGIVEFLLLNHPLDCPICDQGGECDLQDQSLFFGLTKKRFYNYKRVVTDKYLGPIVKTVMTRCIHCTRCVRFATEIAGVEELGVFGRGINSEIGTYINKTFQSELSGNIIDNREVSLDELINIENFIFRNI